MPPPPSLLLGSVMWLAWPSPTREGHWLVGTASSTLLCLPPALPSALRVAPAPAVPRTCRYLGNWTRAGLLSWGRNAGCDFAQLRCNDYLRLHPDNPFFCNASVVQAPGERTCGSSFQSAGTCRTLNFTDGCGVVVANYGQPNCLLGQFVNSECARPVCKQGAEGGGGEKRS